jgi:dihydrofolate reductase
MRNVFLYMTTTLDGFVAGPNNELDWMIPTPEPELTGDIIALLSRADSGFVGYPVATEMVPYWRAAAKDPKNSEGSRALAEAVNRLRTVVISKTREDFSWDNSELLVVDNDADLVDAVTRYKQQPGMDLGVPGGIRTAQRFARLGLIDEYVFMVHPVALGRGKPVFTDRTILDLVSTKAYRSGVVQVRYRPRL